MNSICWLMILPFAPRLQWLDLPSYFSIFEILNVKFVSYSKLFDFRKFFYAAVKINLNELNTCGNICRKIWTNGNMRLDLCMIWWWSTFSFIWVFKLCWSSHFCRDLEYRFLDATHDIELWTFRHCLDVSPKIKDHWLLMLLHL